PNEPSENYKLEQSGQLATKRGVCSPGLERTRVCEWGTTRFCIEDQVVAAPVSGKVLLSVIDHVVKARGPHRFKLDRAIDTGNFHVLPLGYLDGNCAHAAPRPMEEDFLARSHRSGRKETLHCELPGLRKCGGLFESHSRWLQYQRAFGRTHILSKPAPTARPEARQITVDLVCDPKTLNPATDGDNSSRDVGTQNPYTWLIEAERKHRPPEHLPIPIVD